jgi:hypothetical protein
MGPHSDDHETWHSSPALQEKDSSESRGYGVFALPGDFPGIAPILVFDSILHTDELLLEHAVGMVEDAAEERAHDLEVTR